MKIKKIINVTLIQRAQEHSDELFRKLNDVVSSIQDEGNEAMLHFNSTNVELAVLVEEVTYIKQRKLRRKKDV